MTTYQTSTSGVVPAGKAAEGFSGKAARLVHAVDYGAMRECTSRSRLAGSVGEAAEGVVQPANAGASVGAQAVRHGGL